MSKFRTAVTATILLPALLLAASTVTHPPTNANLTLEGISVISLMMRYEYFPHYYAQTLNDSPQYSQIEAMIDDSAKDNASRIVLTEKSTGKPVYFANNQALVDALTRAGNRAYASPIDIKNPQQTIQKATAGFALRDDKGQPVRWRFVYAYSSSAMGSGLTPLPTVPGLTLQYRTEGSVAAEGSAVEVADKVSYAQVWKEISAPPYFVAYRGYSGEGFHEGRFATVDQKWQVTNVPADLSTGAKWDILDNSGKHQTFTVTKAGKEEVVLSTLLPDSQTTLESTLEPSGSGQKLRSLRASQKGHSMLVSCRPSLALNEENSKPVEFQIDLDKNKKVAHGTVEQIKSSDGYHLVWKFKGPDWAKARTLDEVVKATPAEVSLRVTQK